MRFAMALMERIRAMGADYHKASTAVPHDQDDPRLPGGPDEPGTIRRRPGSQGGAR